MFSGWGLRTIIYLFILTAAISTVMLYARKVKKDKSKSIVYELEKEEGHIIQEITYQHFSKRQAASLLIIVATILFNVFGIFVFDWTFNEMSANFLLAGIVAGLVSGLGLNGTFDALIEGMQNILFGAMIVGFAKGIVVILENGKIIDTIVHGMTTLLSDIPGFICYYCYVYITVLT